MTQTCRSCDSYVHGPVVDLGYQYLNDFRIDASKSERHRLAMMLCDGCGLLQLSHTVPRELLYTPSYGFRSGVNENNRSDLQSIVSHALKLHPFAKTWLDIASNDGTLLSFVPKEVHRVGIDPVEKFSGEAEQHANVIIPKFFDPQLVGGLYDVITSISMFYDIEDLNGFVSGVKSVLDRDGIWVIQQNYACDMLTQDSVDNICHEHLTYFTLATLEDLLTRHDLEVIDVGFSTVNGGCIRTTVGHMGEHSISPSVSRSRMRERQMDAFLPDTWIGWDDQVHFKLTTLRRLVRTMAEESVRIGAYGASTRGAVLMQAAGLSVSEVPYAIERQPEKVGKVWTPLGIPIISEDEMRVWAGPSALLCLPYWNRDAFILRESEFLGNGGRMVFPLPELEIYSV